MTAWFVQLHVRRALKQSAHFLRDVRIGMEDHRDGDVAPSGNHPQAGCDRPEPLPPTLPPMTGHQQLSFRVGSARRRPEQRNALEQGIDSGVAGDSNYPGDTFTSKVRRAVFGRREQQIRNRIDRDPEVFLGPGVPPVMTAKTRLDMGDWNAGELRTQGSAQRARGIALNDDQRRVPNERSQPARNLAGVGVRIGLAGASQLDHRQIRNAMVSDPKGRVLAGEDDARADASGDERLG